MTATGDQTSHSPLVSVIIPVYNGERYLAESLESVLNQSYRSFEIILIDDGSTDSTAAVAKYFSSKIKYARQSNAGMGAARNKGISLAAGDYFAFLDADDLFMKDKLSVQVAAFKEDPKLDMVFGHVQQFISPELDPKAAKKIRCPSGLMPGYLPSAMMVKRDSFFHIGLFETDPQIVSILNWYLRTKERGFQIKMLPDFLVRRRLHKNNDASLNQSSIIPKYLQTLRASIQGKRAQGNA